jgi:hypothetical protein
LASVAAALLVAPVNISAEAPAATFRGVTLGQDLRKTLPECGMSERGVTTTCWSYGYGCRQLDKAPAPDSCDRPSEITFRDELNDLFRSGWIVDHSDGVLNSMLTFIKAGQFSDVESLFLAKYGRPAVSSSPDWQSKGGVRTTAQLRIWKWRGATIVLKFPDSSVDTGSLHVATDAWYAKQEAERKADLKRRLKDL